MNVSRTKAERRPTHVAVGPVVDYCAPAQEGLKKVTPLSLRFRSFGRRGPHEQLAEQAQQPRLQLQPRLAGKSTGARRLIQVGNPEMAWV